MNTFQFFMENFGRHFIDATAMSDIQATERCLSANHKTAKGTVSRLSSGWAIIRPGVSSLQLKLAATGISYDDRTRADAFVDELAGWDGETPRIFLEFDKAPVPISNLFVTLDRRLVRICSPKGVESFDLTVDPDPSAGIMQRAIWKRMPK